MKQSKHNDNIQGCISQKHPPLPPMELRLTWAYDAFGKTMYFEAKNKKKGV